MATLHEPTDPVGVAIFAKAPIPGFAKTRLIPRLGAAGAARLQSRLIEKSVATALDARVGPVTLWCAPDRDHELFRRLADDASLERRDQAGADLGARMLAAFDALTAAGPLLLIGTDCPALTPAHLRACATALRSDQDAVIVPAEDGGYVLIGLRRPQPALFEGVSWGTAKVMAQTRVRARELGLRWSEPTTLWDVDLPSDLDRLARSGLLQQRGSTT